LRAQSAIDSAVTAITTTITVAAGVFAPGHLGELTRIVPFELADGVLEDTRTRERRLRALPSRVGVYFVLAMCLFPGLGYRAVWAKLADGLDAGCPDAKALRDLRRRIGPAPLKMLFELLAGPACWPRMPGLRFGRYRTVAFDGCKTVKVPDTRANRGWLGKMKAALGETGYPVIQLMTLCETGTRALIGAVFGTPASGELAWARKLMHLLDESMLVLADRGFDAAQFLAEVAATRAQFLVRLTAARRPPVLGYLPDGSFTSLIGGVKVRIIEASVTVTCADGTCYGGCYRLATTLLDHRGWPAAALIALYHERWEHVMRSVCVSAQVGVSCRRVATRACVSSWRRGAVRCSVADGSGRGSRFRDCRHRDYSAGRVAGRWMIPVSRSARSRSRAWPSVRWARRRVSTWIWLA
jgi:hypothetical protein